MKSLASSIVVFSGSIGMVGSASIMTNVNYFVPFIAFLGALAVLVLGLVGWWTCLKHDR